MTHRPRLVVSRSTCPPISPPPSRKQLCTSCSNKYTHHKTPYSVRLFQDLDAPLRLAAQSKINSYRQQYADNLLFLQAHRETEAHFTAAGMSSQHNQSDSLRFKRAAFYQSLKSKVGVAAAKAAALRVNLNVDGCGIVAAPVHAPSRAPLLLTLILSHNLPLPGVH
jgi:hypothetical protein